MIGSHIENSSFDELEPEISWIKGVRAHRVEDGALGNLAPPGDLEESASHHFDSQCQLDVPGRIITLRAELH